MTERHESSCSVYNMPAYPNGPCDCKYREQNEREALWGQILDDSNALVKDWVKSGAVGRALTPPSRKWFSIKPEPDLDEALDKAVEAIRMSDQ